MALADPAYPLDDGVSRLDRCRLSPLYRRPLYPEAADDVSTAYTSTLPQPTLLAFLLSRLLDAFIFTSAIAITAYNYWTGDMLPPAHKQQVLLDAPEPHERRRALLAEGSTISKLTDTRRQRTEQWAERLATQQQQQQQQQQPRKSTYAQPTLASMNKSQAKQRPKHRSKSLDQPREQDEMLARMQTQLQNLIQEGQAALTSTVSVVDDDDDDDDDFYPKHAIRRMKRYHSA